MSSRAAEDVRVQEQEGLDVAAAARQVAELLLVEAARDGLALQRDVVGGVRGHGDGLGHRAQLELRVHAGGPRRAQHDAGLLVFLEVRSDHLDAVGAGLEVRRLEAALGVGLDRPRHRRALVDDEDRGPADRRALRVDDGPADRAQERLGVRGAGDSQGQEHDEKDPCSHHLLLDGRPIRAVSAGGRDPTDGLRPPVQYESKR